MTDFEKQDQEVMNLVNQKGTATTTPQSACSADSSPDKGSLERILRRDAPQNDKRVSCSKTAGEDRTAVRNRKKCEAGSDPTAAGGRCREGSEWPRSAGDAAAPTARKLPGTATGDSKAVLWLILKIFICALVAVLFVAALLDPDMVPAVANLGVLSCGCVAAVSIDRHFRRCG